MITLTAIPKNKYLRFLVIGYTVVGDIGNTKVGFVELGKIVVSPNLNNLGNGPKESSFPLTVEV